MVRSLLNLAGNERDDNVLMGSQRIGQAQSRSEFGARKIIEWKGNQYDTVLHG